MGGFVELLRIYNLISFCVSGILPVNAHAVINILNLNYINSFIQYSSMTKMSNNVHYNKYLGVNCPIFLRKF